jgi:hypothetical protein
LTEIAFGSAGQRNTLVEYLYWGTEGERLRRAYPLVRKATEVMGAGVVDGTDRRMQIAAVKIISSM